jgi:hypothetical protein
MAESLIGAVMQTLSPSVIERLGGSFGENREATQKGVAAVIPALLAGLGGLAEQPGGAERVAASAQLQDAGIVDNLSRIVGGSDQGALMDSGQSLLTSLFGGETVDDLIGAVSKYAGLRGDSAAGMMAVLAPVIMAVLGRQKRSMGLDADALGRLLSTQKGAIASLVPAGFSSLLGATGLRDSIVGALEPVKSNGAIGAARPAGVPSWAYALGVIVIALIGYWLWYGAPSQRVAGTANERAVSGSSQPPHAAGSVMVGQIDVAKEVRALVDDTSKSLGNVTDAASAQKALPALNDVVAEFDKIKAMTGQIPADGRQTLTRIVGEAKPGLLKLIDQAQAAPGVAGVLKPTLDALKGKLDRFTTEI